MLNNSQSLAFNAGIFTQKKWVKNVHSLWVERGDTCGYLYTTVGTQLTASTATRVKPSTYTHSSPTYTPHIFTRYFTRFNLLIHHLYTVSTAPIIKTKKLKRRKDT